MRGVGYAATEIIGLIVLAAIIGFAIGWLLRRFLYDVDVSDYESRVAEALDLQHRAETELGAAQGRVAETASIVTKLQSEVAQVEAEASGLEAEVDAARTATRERDGRIEALESELAGLRAEAATNADAVEERNIRIEVLESEITGLRADLDAALATGGAQEVTIGELQAELAALEALRGEVDAGAARIAELEVLVVEKETAGDRITELEQELATTKAQLGGATTQLEAATTELGAARTQLSAAEAELGDVKMQLASAEAQLAAARARLEQGRVAAAADPSPATGRNGGAPEPVPSREPAASPVPVASSGDRPHAGASAIGAVAARTAGDGPVADDDLKKVHGIGPKLEALLKGLGITSFRQIARFTPDDVAIVTEALDAFPGRIERDGWIAGAAEQHEKAYGEPV